MKKLLCLFAALIFLADSLYCQDAEREIISLLLSSGTVRDRDITQLIKINMGIPGGDNWLVEWTAKPPRGIFLYVYVVNGGNIIHEILLGNNFNVSEVSSFDIMGDIPGTQIGKGSSAIYDYNDDGLDDFFNYGLYGRGFYIIIKGYDTEKGSIEEYAEIPFEIIDREKGPAPIEFITYKRMKGFKVFYLQNEVAGGPGWISDPDPKNGKWIFYTWDKLRREFVEVEEFDEAGLEETYRKPQELILEEEKETSQLVLEIHNTDEFAETRVEQKPAFTQGLSSYIGIGGIFVIAAAAIFFVIRKKKRV